MITLHINSQPIKVEAGTTILEAAKKLHYRIPTLCYKEGLSIYGGCRLCVVEVKGRSNLPIACAEEVQEGMEVFTHSDLVLETRRNIFQLLIANHPFDCQLNCLTCLKSSSCELRKLAEEIGVGQLKYEALHKPWTMDTSSRSVVIETSKCISCGRCVRTCNEIQHGGILTMSERGLATKVDTFMAKGLGNVDCTNCGQCILACPTGAIHEVYHVNQVIQAINDPDTHVVIQTAPAVRVAIGEEFGAPLGMNLEKKIVTALRKMGADKVFDTNFTADLTIIEEGTEFINRINHQGVLPIITSCSPGWIKFAEHNYPDLLPNISTCKSPQQMFGTLAKTYYAEKEKLSPDKIVSVSIMPCTAKKYELARDELKDDVDYVLTTRELAKLIRAYGLEFMNLPDGEYDQPFGISTGAAAIFGVSGGVMEAALRTGYELISGKELEELEFVDIRGLKGIKEAVVDIDGEKIRVAVANGLENAVQMLKHKEKYHFIEIMTCPGGCIGGGGQPISDVDNILEERMTGIYATDQKREIRKSHKNPAIIKLYEEFLGEPNGEKAHRLLHTHYMKR
ncbi:NADH-dependent [FeFe] hydrogenase, group A6 [Gottschalkiaceae bacterium SANA]|nr:NADH-dependent [FeFe] hydrogenase, group A6 [Gottschalkiaceae bacterium SANA]